MNFRDRNYIIGSSSTESLKGAAFLSKMLGILHEKRVATPHAELVADVITTSASQRTEYTFAVSSQERLGTKEAEMKIIGCDLHTRQQTIAMVDTETGEFTEKTLSHEGNAVREFYAALEPPVVVGIEATGAMQWFLELLEELGIECRVGHPAKVRAAETRKQKHDRRDAHLLLDLLVMKDRFPEIWMPSTEQRDLRTLLPDRHQWVKMRTRLRHTLQAIALNHALRQGRALWSTAGQSALQALPLPPYRGQRRTELLRLYVQLQKRIQALDKEVEIVEQRF
jgi:transposase